MLRINRTNLSDVLLELGGGSNPIVHPRCLGGPDVNIDSRFPCNNEEGTQCVDVQVDFNHPLPLADNEFDGVVSHFSLEHVSFRNVPQLLEEVHRVCKPGAKVIFVVPNTENQLQWIKNHGVGWDGKDLFIAASELLYGSQDYSENAHCCYFSPVIAQKLFQEAGFVGVKTMAYPPNERGTDLLIEAVKPHTTVGTGNIHISEGIHKYKPLRRSESSVNRPELAQGEAKAVDSAKAAASVPEQSSEQQTVHYNPDPYRCNPLCDEDGDLLSGKITATHQDWNEVTCPQCLSLKAVGVTVSQEPTLMGRPVVILTKEEYAKRYGPPIREYVMGDFSKEPFIRKQMVSQETTLRKAKMIVLDADHPDLQEFEPVVSLPPEPMRPNPVQSQLRSFPEGRWKKPPMEDQIRGSVGSVGPVGAEGPKGEPGETESYAEQVVKKELNIPEGVLKQPYPTPREQLFDRVYFNGGAKVGGYAREGLWDFPIHNVTAAHILTRKPESVLELGSARGYILKRIQDQGVYGEGLEISKHCYMTRVCEGIRQYDLCKTPWPISANEGKGVTQFDLCFSIAMLEHIPEGYLPAIIKEMARTCKRGLHGIDFGEKDDGFDKTHCTLRTRQWWIDRFTEHAPGWSVELLDKEELEKGEFPHELFQDGGKVKVNCGSFTTMHHHGWINVDQHDLSGFANQYGYRFARHDLRNGLQQQPTGTVDLIHTCHFLEHITAREGLAFLRECRRLLKPTGAMRIIVPDARLLSEGYVNSTLGEFDEINDGCADSPTQAGKFWSLLHEGHSAAYDMQTLCQALKEAGFDPRPASFRKTNAGEAGEQILRECLDMLPCLSIYCDAIPSVS